MLSTLSISIQLFVNSSIEKENIENSRNDFNVGNENITAASMIENVIKFLQQRNIKNKTKKSLNTLQHENTTCMCSGRMINLLISLSEF